MKTKLVVKYSSKLFRKANAEMVICADGEDTVIGVAEDINPRLIQEIIKNLKELLDEGEKI